MNCQLWKRLFRLCLLVVLLWGSCSLMAPSPALANLDDDRYDGNIFILYAGNGSLIPPTMTLEQSLKKKRPALLTFYVDDSSDCKKFAIVISQLQSYYGRAASFIPVDVDALPVKSSYAANEPGYYYEGAVPQTVLFDSDGKVVFNAQGQVAFEKLDDVLREVFDLLPRSESVELKRRSINEFSGELAE